MAVPADKKEQAIYHTILSEMHRLHASLLNLQTLDDPSTAASLRDHFTREQNLALGKLNEWQKRRRDVYDQAFADFGQQVQRDDGS